MIARQWFKYRVSAAHTPDSAEFLGIEMPADFSGALRWRGQGEGGGDGSGDLLHARNEASRRYVTWPPEFYVPGLPATAAWRSRPGNSKQGSGGPVDDVTAAEATTRLQSLIVRGLDHYDWALASGICAEQARLFLPACGIHTVWRWTASVQAIAHFLTQRLGKDAQGEVQLYACAVRTLVVPLFPTPSWHWCRVTPSTVDSHGTFHACLSTASLLTSCEPLRVACARNELPLGLLRCRQRLARVRRSGMDMRRGCRGGAISVGGACPPVPNSQELR